MNEVVRPLEKSLLTDTLEELVRNACGVCGVDFWGLEFRKTQSRAHLRVFIDTKDGVSLSSCEEVSRQFADLLDVQDPIDVPYTLEVSSPGINRRLFFADQYQNYLGEKLHIRLKEKRDEKLQYKGILKCFDERALTMLEGSKEDEKEITFLYDETLWVRLDA